MKNDKPDIKQFALVAPTHVIWQNGALRWLDSSLKLKGAPVDPLMYEGLCTLAEAAIFEVHFEAYANLVLKAVRTAGHARFPRWEDRLVALVEFRALVYENLLKATVAAPQPPPEGTTTLSA